MNEVPPGNEDKATDSLVALGSINEDFPEEVTVKGKQGFGRGRRGWACRENACRVERAASEAACDRGCGR